LIINGSGLVHLLKLSCGSVVSCAMWEVFVAVCDSM